MQLFPCPFCGPRPETEFSFEAEAGKIRPEPADEVSAERWAAYLYAEANPKGASREIWLHLACGEVFVLARNTATHAVAGSEALRREGAERPEDA